MGKVLRDVFPPIYSPLLPDLFDRETIVETRATCNDCAMCDRGKPSPVPMEYFQPDLKCCTYNPHLPNYLVGSVLADASPDLAEGRERLKKRIASRFGVTPERVSPPRKQNLLATMASDSGFFGRSNAIVCPYLDREHGLCTIWKHREGVCSTYYCKYTHGALGFAFWRSVKEYLGYVEVGLARWAARSVDPTVTEPQLRRGQLTLEDLEDRPPNDDAYARYWGSWLGREEAFYIECHRLVKTMSKAEFEKVVHARKDAVAWLDASAKRYDEALSPLIPARLVRNKEMRERPAGDGDSIVVSTYNRFDSFAIGKELYDVLGMFREEETLEENLARLDKEHGIELAPELLRELYVQNVLVPPVKPEEPASATEQGTPKTG